MFALVGLGNPGAQYQHNRHNVGFMALDEIARAYGFPDFQKKDRTLYTSGKIEGQSVLCIKPQSFMNVSGPPLVPFLMFHKIPLANCFIFHDELDLPFAKVRVKTGGGHGGHNGLRSLDQHVGNGYNRIRIGIGRPPVPEMVSGYVLSDFSSDERPLMADVLDNIAKHVPLLLNQDPALFMTRLSPPPPPKKEPPHGI